jgi:hypothetical protein
MSGDQISHAYVRFRDDNVKEIVKISDIKNFLPSHINDFEKGKFIYRVKWTDKHGVADYYKAEIGVLGSKFYNNTFYFYLTFHCAIREFCRPLSFISTCILNLSIKNV